MIDGLLDQLSGKGGGNQTDDAPTWFSAWAGNDYKISMANAFIMATPRSPVLADAIRRVLNNIQQRLDVTKGGRGMAALFATGPHLFGEAFAAKGEDENSRLGRIKDTAYFYDGRFIIRHKCRSCITGQDWSEGNNYFKKYNAREYFCPDARSIYIPK